MKANDLIYGSIAGINGKLIEYPFDTIKVRLQVSPASMFNGPIDCITKSLKQDGIGGLYRGLSAPLAGCIFENALLFQSYSFFQNQLKSITNHETTTIMDYTVSGFMSGAVVSLLLTPIELIKCKIQVQNSSNEARVGPVALIRSIYKANGMRGFYNGHMGTFIRESIGCAVWFGVYEYTVERLLSIRKVASKAALDPVNFAVCGALAGMTFNLVVYPVDVIKSRQQTQIYGASVFNIIKEVYKLGGFYRGLGITLARSAPVSGVVFFTYESLSRKFD